MRVPFNAGFLSGIALFLIALGLCFWGISPFWKWRYVAAWIPPVAIGAGIILSRPTSLSEAYPFAQAFKNGLLTTFFMASTKAMLLYVFIILRPDVMKLHLNEVRQDVALVLSGPLAGALPANEDAFMKLIEAETTPTRLALADFQGNLLGGLLLSFIFGLLFSRKRKGPASHEHA